MRIQQSLCYPMFQPMEHSLDRLFAHAATCGYAAVEMWGRDADFLQVVATAKKHGLTIASMGGHQSLVAVAKPLRDPGFRPAARVMQHSIAAVNVATCSQ